MINKNQIKQIDKLLLGHIFFAFMTITAFILIFSKTFNILVLHLVLITSAYSITFILCRFSKSYFKHLAIVLFSSLTTLITFIYLANFLSNTFWNDNVSFSFILTYLTELDTVLEEVPFAIELLIIVFIFILASITWFYSRHVVYLHSFDHKLKLKDFRLYIAVTLITSVYVLLSYSPTDPGLWDGEPISSLALKTDIKTYLTNNSELISFDTKANHQVNPNLQNIILIHADALRADHMSGYGYNRNTTPYIDSLINNGAIKVDMGLSICSESICGMLAALGSRHPDVIQPETPLIHSYLKQAGYRTVFTGSGNFSWERLDSILSHDIDHFDRADLDDNFSIHDDSIILSTLSKMPEYNGVPTFFFLRYLSSHPIGRHFSQYQKYSPAEKNLLGYLFPSMNDSQILVNAYDNYIIQLDDMVRQSVALLSKKGYIENSLIVIFGDHGDALNEHGYYGHYTGLYQEEIHVPILFKSSKELLLKETRFATLNDILPTVLETNNIPLPTDIDGHSLFQKMNNRITYHDSRTGKYAAVQKEGTVLFKLIFNSKTGEQYLYNLSKDPAELNNIITEDKARSVKLLKQLKQRFNLT